MTRGVAVISSNALQDRTAVERLIKHGVDRIDVIDLSEIKTVSDKKSRCKKIIRSMQTGDRLVFCTVFDFCDHLEELMELLSYSAENYLLIESLEEAWLAECCQRMQATPHFELFKLMHTGIRAMVRHQEKTGAGIPQSKDRKRPKNRYGSSGRPKGSIKINDEKLEMAVKMYCEGKYTVREICDILQCNERSMYRYFRLKGVNGKRKTPSVKSPGQTTEA